jgi:coenzyme F420-reducing hydrogenase gamma subunit
MAENKKVKVAWFDFTCCEGCQIEMTNFGEPFLELLQHVEPVEFREAMSETAEEIDIAFVEGSFTRECDRERLEKIRERAKIVITYGTCAVTGGINALKNHMDKEDYKACVYGDDKDMPHLETDLAKPISAAIKVDYEIPGCPIERDEFIRIVSQLLHGVEPKLPKHPVCVECKLRETVCRYDLGDHCLGPIARAGCGAPCPAAGIPCEACREFVNEPNHKAIVKVLIENGKLSKAWAEKKSKLFTANLREDTKNPPEVKETWKELRS